MRIVITAIVAMGLVGGGALSSAASARSPNEIYGPVFQRYKNLTDARKKLRNLEKKGQLSTGEEYYALGHVCQYEEPASQSIILTALSRSRCKERSGEYFVEAGMRGVPEGFVSAAKFLGRGDQAYLYAQVAYQLSGDDASLRSEALELISSLSGSVSNIAVVDKQSIQLATQLATDGPYAGLRNAATTVEVQNRLPSLAWLDFKNPKRCEWSAAASAVIKSSYDFDYDSRSGNITIPQDVRIPGYSQTVRSRISRPEPDYPEIVTVNTDFKGQWNGLTVLGLTDSFIEESDGLFGSGIRFAEPVAHVARVLASQGFYVNSDGSEREQVDKEESFRYKDERGQSQLARNINGVVTSIERKNGETVFLCNEVYQIMG